MSYDSGIVTFTTKTDKVDLVAAAHINAVQAELVIIETILGTGIKGDRADLKTRLNNALDADGSILSGSSFPSPALPSQGFYRTDLDVFYVRNAANSIWNAQGVSLSNVLFQYVGYVDVTVGDRFGEMTNASLTPGAGNGLYRFLAELGNSSFIAVKGFKFVKTSGINTVTVWCRIWTTSGSHTASFKLAIGSVSGTVNGTAHTSTPEWKSFTIDVSSLINGTTYDVTASMYESENNGTVFCSDIIGFGS